jgi:hypothetical protein
MGPTDCPCRASRRHEFFCPVCPRSLHRVLWPSCALHSLSRIHSLSISSIRASGHFLYDCRSMACGQVEVSNVAERPAAIAWKALSYMLGSVGGRAGVVAEVLQPYSLSEKRRRGFGLSHPCCGLLMQCSIHSPNCV